MTPLPTSLTLASRRRRFASLGYELLLLTALILVATFPFVGFTGGKISFASRIALQVYLLVICGTYFLWFWRHGGQTLPMKTWHIRLVTAAGVPVQYRLGIARYLLATAGLALAGIGFWWSLLDRDRQFLHDRLCGTRIVVFNLPGNG